MIRNLTALLAALGIAAANAADTPIADSDRLTLPRVDTKSQVGMYQDATLTRLPSGDFRLESVDVLGADKVYPLRGITAVDVRTIGTAPATVYLSVSGVDFDCDHVSPLRLSQRLVGKRFDVVISSRHLLAAADVTWCLSGLGLFRLTVPLETYGLKAGVYTYTVNGTHSGQFVLPSDNRFPDDCHQTLELNCPYRSAH